MATEDIATGGLLGAATTLGGGLLLWLRSRVEASRAEVVAQAQAEQVKAQAQADQVKAQADVDQVEEAGKAQQFSILADLIKENQRHLTMAMDRIDRMSAKLAAQAATIDELRAKFSESERDRIRLTRELGEANHKIEALEAHVEALTGQIRELGQQPVSSPAPTRDQHGRFSGRGKGRPR